MQPRAERGGNDEPIYYAAAKFHCGFVTLTTKQIIAN